MQKPARTKRNLAPAIVLLVLAAALLTYRVWSTTHKPKAEALLRLGSDVPVPDPPLLPGDDVSALRERLEPVVSARVLLTSSTASRADLLGLAQRAGLAGDNLTAWEALQAAMRKEDVKDPAVLDALGRTELQLALFKRAQSSYEKLKAMLPHDIRGYLGESRALSGQGKNQEALTLLDQATRAISPQDAPGWLQLSSEFQERGDLTRALDSASKAVYAAPSDPAVALAMARLEYDSHDMEEARKLAEPLVSAHPDNGRARLLFASILSSPLNPSRDARLAEHQLLSAAEHDPQSIEALQRLGELYREQDRHREAAYVYGRLLQLSPALTVARMQLATAYQALGDPRAAEQREIARKLMERDRQEARLTIQRNQRPTDPLPRLALARFYAKQGHYGRAFSELQPAFALTAGQGEPRQALAQLYTRIGLPFDRGRLQTQ